MKIWLPYVQSGSGADIFTEILARALCDLGCEAVLTTIAHHWQFLPWAKRRLPPPQGANIAVVNSWNGFAFHRAGIPLVAVEHHCVHDPAFGPYRNSGQALFHDIAVRRFERETFRVADAIVAISHYTAQSLGSIFHLNRIKVIPNGIDTDFFRPATEPIPPTFAERPVRLLFVGNLTRRKGADLLPRIMDRLGEGYELRYTSGLRVRKTFNTGKNMIPLGWLDREQLRQAYRQADLLLFPTRLEGFGYAAVEAMACGIPVVASAVASLPEIVEDGVTGRLCPVDDVDAFAAAIRCLARNPVMLAEMSWNARRVADERFAEGTMAQRYLELFQNLVSPAGSVRSPRSSP